MVIGLVAALAATVAFGVASVLQAIGAREEPTATRFDVRLLVRLMRHPIFAWSMLLSLVGFLLHLVALRWLPLFVVQPIIAASVAVTAVISGRMAREPLGARVRLLVVGVCVGLVMLAAGAVPGKATATSIGQRALLLGVVLGLALLGWLALRVPGARGAALLGLLSGVGYAVVAVAGRSMPTLLPPSVLADPAAHALVLGGALAVLLYSMSLQRDSVVSATAAMVLGNTVAPLLVGLLFLGDRVREGWAPVAAGGLLLAVASVFLLHDPRTLGATTTARPAPDPTHP